MTRRMDAGRRWVAATLVGTLLASCAGQPAPEPVRQAPEPPSATADMVGVRLGGLEWADAGEVSPGRQDRFAVIIGGESDVDPAFAVSNVRMVRDVLETACHIPEQRVELLSGPLQRPDTMRDAILSVGDRARGQQALLVVYLTGLSVVDEQGVVRYLTPDARHKLDGRWEGTLPREDLTYWLSQASARASERGTKLQTVFVTDTPRAADSAPNPGVALKPSTGWELHAWRHGRADAAPTKPAPTTFTRGFVNALRTLAEQGRAAPVELVFEHSREAVAVVTTGRQVPELIAPFATDGSSPALVASRRVACAIEVLGAIDDAPVVGAEVRMDARERVSGSGLLPISILPGRHLLRVSAPGHLTRVEEFDVAVSNAGRVLKVRLLPNLVHVQGWVSPPDRTVVSVEGLAEGSWREGYHIVRAVPDEDGSFELRLPRLGADLELVVRESGDERLRRAIPQRPERFMNAEGDVVEGLGLVDLGPVRLPGGHPLQLLDEAQRALVKEGSAGALPLPEGYEDPPSVPESAWDSEADAERWDAFNQLADSKDWMPALAQLDALMDEMDPAAYEAWRGWLELAYADEGDELSRIEHRLEVLPPQFPNLRLALASRMLSVHLDRAYGRATQGETACVSLLRQMPMKLLNGEGPYRTTLVHAVESRRYGVASTLLARLVAEERWKETLNVLSELGSKGSWGSVTFSEIRREVLHVTLEAELDTALQEGLAAHDWRRAERILSWMTDHGERLGLTGTPALLSLAERIAVERVPGEVRETFAQAQQTFLDGDVVEADALYAQLEGRMRGRYAEFIVEQRSRLRPQLFVRHLKEGEALEVEGRLEEAAVAYARALVYDRRAAPELLRLGISTPGLLIVSTDGRSEYSEIGPALASSLPDAVVLVGPGTYRESLLLSGTRTVLGTGGEVVVEATGGSALSVPSAAEVSISGVTLRTAGRGVPTVRLDDGRLVLESCRVVAAQGGPAVAVGGPSARAELRRCEIPSTDGDAFFVSGDARLELSGCAVGLPRSAPRGEEHVELRRYVIADSPRHVRVSDTVFGRYELKGSTRLTAQLLARIQRSNVLRVSSDPAAWPGWAIAQLTHCATIGEALEAAESGATIRIAPGTYSESLQPTRSVNLIADTRDGGVVIVDGGQNVNALRLDDDVSVSIKGVTFRLHKPDEVQRSETIAVRRGHLELADCRIEAFDSTDTWQPEGLAVGMPDELLVDVVVDDEAVVVEGEDPVLVAQARAESAVAAASSVILRRCRISSDALGITVRGDNKVAVWDSEIVGRLAGVLPSRGGQADLVATTIRGSVRGVQLGGPDATARLEACILTGNEEAFSFEEGAEQEQLELAGTTVR